MSLAPEIKAFLERKAAAGLPAVWEAPLDVIRANTQGRMATSGPVEPIQEIINHSELEICFAEGNEVLNEQTIIQKEGKTVKPDRMVLTKNKEVFLLDYKTGTHNVKYQQQLESYQAAIEKMGYKVVKKTLVYIGKEIVVIDL